MKLSESLLEAASTYPTASSEAVFFAAPVPEMSTIRAHNSRPCGGLQAKNTSLGVKNTHFN
jgi:hypothetical protein